MEEHLLAVLNIYQHIINTEDLLRQYTDMTNNWTHDYRNWFENHVREKRHLRLSQFYNDTAALLRSDIQSLDISLQMPTRIWA